MKITGIDIGEYRQFKNIKFDFTYPEGHAKAGQPLDKVCFIGQSGTGKTTLLNVFWELIETINKSFEIASNNKIRSKTFDSSLPESIGSVKFFASTSRGELIIGKEEHEKTISHKDYLINWAKGIPPGLKHSLLDTNKLCVYIKESISREADAFLFDQKKHRETFSDFVKTTNQIDEENVKKNRRIDEAGRQRILTFGEMKSLPIWQYILRDADNYNEENWRLLMGFRNRGLSPNQMVSDLSKWQETHRDPREDLAHYCIDPILGSFFLKLDTSVANVPIALKMSNGTQLDSSLLSTGTRQLLSTAIPLYKLNTKDTIILFDEPERSLFPDIQRDLIKYYTSLAPESQFFFATHSPIIASSFEPCERFILYFDEDGEVNYRKGVAPIGDDPNDLLSSDFGLNELMLDEGLEQYKRYTNLFIEIKKEMDPDRKKRLMAEQVHIGNTYNF